MILTSHNIVYFPVADKDIENAIFDFNNLLPDSSGWDSSRAYAVQILKNGYVKAVVMYTNFSGENCEMHIASDSKDWCTRRVLHDLFWYPFEVLKVNRVSAVTRKKDISLQSFMHRIGFEHEGTMKEFYDNDDALMWGMLKRHCQWFKSKVN